MAGDLERAGKARGVRVLTVYGGRAYEPQIEALKRGVEIVVGTPGRLIDLAQQGHLDLSAVRSVVLDEADEMLDLGFLPDVEKLLALTPASRQTMLFSATMPGAVVSLARRYMTQPTHIRAIDEADDGPTVKAIEQFVYRAHAMDKVEMLARILQAEGRGLTIIFSRTKRTAAKVADELADRGFAAAAIHGDLGQGAREQALRAFRNGKVDVLVATDVAARGIDVEDVTHVVNYQCPEDEKTYLHRIGRTGRAGNTGVAVTFVDWDDLPRWGLINRTLDLGIPEPQETYSTSDHLFTDLDIPAGPPGGCPRATRPAPAWRPSRSRTSARPASPPARYQRARHQRARRRRARLARAGRRGWPLRRGALLGPVPLPRPAPRRQRPSGRRRDRYGDRDRDRERARGAPDRRRQAAPHAQPPSDPWRQHERRRPELSRGRGGPRLPHDDGGTPGCDAPRGPSVSRGGRQSRSSSAVATSR